MQKKRAVFSCREHMIDAITHIQHQELMLRVYQFIARQTRQISAHLFSLILKWSLRWCACVNAVFVVVDDVGGCYSFLFLFSNSLCIFVSLRYNSCNTDPFKFNEMPFHSWQRQKNHQNNNMRFSSSHMILPISDNENNIYITKRTTKK